MTKVAPMGEPLTNEQAQRAFMEATRPTPEPALDIPGETLLLIDLSGIYWAHWHSTADQAISEAFERTVAAVLSFARGPNVDHVAICCDHGPYWRRDILPTYKAQRAEAPPLAVEQFTRVKERLRADGFLLWAAPSFEADDVIAWAVAQAKADDRIGKLTIVSNDKDLHQLVEECVTCYAPMTRAYVGRAAVIDKHGVPPELMLDYLALLGDTSDNVPGVPGVGAKTAALLLTAFGSLEAVLEEAAKPERESKITKPKLKQSLIDHAEAARLARSVITLRTDLPLKWEELYMEREPEPIIENPGDVDEPEPTPASQPPPPMTASNGNGNGNGHGSSLATVAEPERQPLAVSAVSTDWSLGLEPNTLSAAHKLAQYLVNSRLYSRFPNAEAIWAVIIRGREMGLGALEALDAFHVVEGRPVPSAHLLIGRAMKHPDCEYFQFIGGDDTYAEYEAKRRGNPKPAHLKYTLEDAKRAEVIKPGSAWTKRPAEMLRKTAGVQLARILFPEVMGAYAMEELV